jgi:hypothetical protein
MSSFLKLDLPGAPHRRSYLFRSRRDPQIPNPEPFTQTLNLPGCPAAPHWKGHLFRVHGERQTLYPKS